MRCRRRLQHRCLPDLSWKSMTIQWGTRASVHPQGGLTLGAHQCRRLRRDSRLLGGPLAHAARRLQPARHRRRAGRRLLPAQQVRLLGRQRRRAVRRGDLAPLVVGRQHPLGRVPRPARRRGARDLPGRYRAEPAGLDRGRGCLQLAAADELRLSTRSSSSSPPRTSTPAATSRCSASGRWSTAAASGWRAPARSTGCCWRAAPAGPKPRCCCTCCAACFTRTLYRYLAAYAPTPRRAADRPAGAAGQVAAHRLRACSTCKLRRQPRARHWTAT